MTTLEIARKLQLVLMVQSPGRVRHAQELAAQLVTMLETEQSKGDTEC